MNSIDNSLGLDSFDADLLLEYDEVFNSCNFDWNDSTPTTITSVIAETYSAEDDDCPPTKKFCRSSQFDDLAIIIKKSDDYGKFYSPVKSDYRQIYTTLMFESLNAFDFNFLKDIAYQIIDDSCKWMCKVTDEGIKTESTKDYMMSTSPGQFVDHVSSFMNNCPDALIYPYKYNFVKLCHIPISFAGIPYDWILNSNFLNAYLLKLAKDQRIYPQPGYAIIGKCLLTGTKLVNSNEEEICMPLGQPGKFQLEEIYIYVLNDKGKICRVETYIQYLPTSASNLIKYELS